MKLTSNNTFFNPVNIVLTFILVLATGPVLGGSVLQQETQPEGAVIVPDNFLRRWDPVTLFFKSAKGISGEVEVHADKFVQFEPEHPGVFTWLNEKTLQFKPVDPWQPYTGYKWSFDGNDVVLDSLMVPPKSTSPYNGQQNLQPIESVQLVFDEPVTRAALDNMIRIEIRDLPGMDEGSAYWLGKQDYEIKVVERKKLNDDARYELNFLAPITFGKKVFIHFKLAKNDQLEQAFQTINFSTSRPFEVKHFGCGQKVYPASVSGNYYGDDQVIQCPSENRYFSIDFSSALATLNPMEARNLVRITPSVENLEFETAGNRVFISGDFVSDQLYQLSLQPSSLKDQFGRKLLMDGPNELYAYFMSRAPFLSVDQNQRIMERFGPQTLPITGSGHERVDVRIHAIDPLDRNFWPFSSSVLSVNEDSRPEGPGKSPANYTKPDKYISQSEIRRHIRQLPAPQVSELVDLPLSKSGGTSNFGLDLGKFFKKIKGENQPGTYLVGLRKLNSSTTRHWVRLQVTDLSLSTINDNGKVNLFVTSLRTGQPVSGASVRLEGTNGFSVSGITDNQGLYTWNVPNKIYKSLRRFVVSKGNDTLVLRPGNAPELYRNNLWQQDNRWLNWTYSYDQRNKNTYEFKCHIFSDRPVYKPEEEVHIKGYIRDVNNGQFSIPNGNDLTLVVDGPGDNTFWYDLELTEGGGFYVNFNEQEIPTGNYRVYLEGENKPNCGQFNFSKEAYRIPKFEVTLNGPEKTGLDTDFQVTLNADYYAGGPVVDQDVFWQITEFPYSWSPKKQKGFYYSTDARFSGQGQFRAQPFGGVSAKTDNSGGATLTIDPSKEPTAQPRKYVIEATVTGADDQQVNATFEVAAVPATVLGVKVPRFSKEFTNLNAEILVTDPDGTLKSNQLIQYRLIHRQWHSHLQAGDFSQGIAKYVTEVVDEPVMEGEFLSQSEIQKIELPLEMAGVYILEVETQDQLGRLQRVNIDFFAGGEAPVTWSKPESGVFKVTTERPVYDPGEQAHLILQSPYQEARALAIVERPDGENSYEWIDIKNGTASYRLDVNQSDLPRIPVHFMLIRGRIGAIEPGKLDLGKPGTMAASTYVEVSTAANKIKLGLEYQKKALPGETITVDIELKDNKDSAISGEVTLWLVDQSVLSLGVEQTLDPIPDFIPHRNARISLRDTRNWTLGYTPVQERTGGGIAMAARMEQDSLLDNVTVRKNFKTVPYYNPNIIVDSSGKASVTIELPDNLTNFKVRAKVVSQTDKFGFARGQISVRLPVIVQPSLPRFIRAGDEFTAITLGRIVEGEGGPGRSEAKFEGMKLASSQSSAVQNFEWDPLQPQRIEYRFKVPLSAVNQQQTVSLTVAVERNSDQARDAFSKQIPVLPDQNPIKSRTIFEFDGTSELVIPGITDSIQPGSLKRSLLLSPNKALLQMATGLDYLLAYPHGCAEQRMSKARAILAAEQFSNLFSNTSEERKKIVQETLVWLENVLTPYGLVSYWPGSNGSVSLTAWAVMFFDEAETNGYSVNFGMKQTMIDELKSSLRSNYSQMIFGDIYEERTWALMALSRVGEIDKSYAMELARNAQYLNVESLALVIIALESGQNNSEKQLEKLYDSLWSNIIFRLHQNKEIYGGLQDNAVSNSEFILPSEIRTIAQVARAAAVTPDNIMAKYQDKLQTMTDALINLGTGTGWGSTNANAAAMLALSEIYQNKALETENRSWQIQVNVADKAEPFKLSYQDILDHELPNKGDVGIAAKTPLESSIMLIHRVSYLPAQDGSFMPSRANGFAVSRDQSKIQSGDVPNSLVKMTEPGQEINYQVGDVVEDHVEVVNPIDGHHVAVIIPLAAGMEPLNPALATAPPEAVTDGQITLAATYVKFLDDQVAFYYDNLPKGNYHFYFRTRATIPGIYIQPAAYSEKMYDELVNGNSVGAKIVITSKGEGQ